MPNNPIHVKLAESLGANIVIMDMGEIFTTFGQGWRMNRDIHLPRIKTEGWYEGSTGLYFMGTNHIPFHPWNCFAGDEFWNSLSWNSQKAFEEGLLASDYTWDLYEKAFR